MRKVPKIVAIDQRDLAYEAFLSRAVEADLEFVEFKDLPIGFDGKTPPRTDIDMLLFTGGEDVNPAWYNESKGSHTYCNNKRDSLARAICDFYGYLPKLGICRGAQFLTVLAGGKLIQHVEDHAIGNGHSCTVVLGSHTTEITVTSTHHQMMFPYNLKRDRFRLLGWSTKHRSNIYLNGKDQQIDVPSDFLEPEIVFYPTQNALAIQGHPEFDKAGGDFKQVCYQYINEYLCQQ